MTPKTRQSILHLMLSALALTAILFLTGEAHWGSDAMFVFLGVWALHVVTEVRSTRRSPQG